MQRLIAFALAVAAGAAFTNAAAQLSTRAPVPPSVTTPTPPAGWGVLDLPTMGPPPLPCGQYDDGTSENALGLIAGGEIGWLHRFTCFAMVTHIDTAYGSALFPGSVTNGSSGRVALYEEIDGDGNPNTGLLMLASAATVVVNGDTDILNEVPLSGAPCYDFDDGESRFILATADHSAGEFPAPMDLDNPTGEAWVVGSTSGPGTLDLVDLTNNAVPPMNMAAIGLPTAWLLRDGGICPPPILSFCFGDGSGAPCGCGNEAPSGGGGGCLNGLGASALLTGTGAPDTTADTVVLSCTGVRAQPGLFFQGDNAIAGGLGATFGDGIRCCGSNVVRLEVVHPAGPEPTTASTTATISQQGPPGTVNPGDTRCYQYWYRDPNLSPCGTNFNLSNGYGLTWS